ncbi:MAG: MoeA-like protein [Fusobacteria bacterium]|nr:MAG: MoeA-like protein [Fusobacteriota bacterium]KAF0229637.1 MAG: MoeA-like [Fusobacteriota bacterium]
MNSQFIREQIKGGHIYCFIGAGGKTSAIKEAAIILAEEGYRVLITTTTKISVEEFSKYRIDFSKSISIDNMQDGINIQVSSVVGGKYQGYKKEDIENIVQIPLDVVILIEADGSRGLPFKVPYEHEPVVPVNSTKNFLFFSAKIMGEKISSDNTYNLEKIQTIIGEKDMLYTNENILKLLNEGWIRDTKYRNLKVIINQGEILKNTFIAKDLLKQIYDQYGIGSYLVSLKEKKIYQCYDDKVGVLILAAGEGRRMGRIKQLLKFGGSTFLEETIKKYSAYSQDIIVTLGFHKEEIKGNIKELGFKFQEIKKYKEGMSASFREARAFDTDFFLVTPCDLPLVEDYTIEILLKTYRDKKGEIIVPRYMGVKGHPVVFPIALQSSFKNINGDIGARDIIKEMGCVYVDLDDPGIIADIDTLNEYLKIKEE